jgi:hypothetical protein
MCRFKLPLQLGLITAISMIVMHSTLALADVPMQLLRRVAVFPIADANFGNAEDAWWQMRELLTKDQRFFVASRRFMINRGVFQARTTLKPADAIILGKILDAQALVVSQVKDRHLNLKVYDGENGYLLWEGVIQFHPAISINDQIIRASNDLVNDFIAGIPYQGFQIVDELIGKPLYEAEGKKLAQVFVGSSSNLKVGDPVQWVQVTGSTSVSFLNSAPKITVIAEGEILELKNDKVVVEVLKLRDPAELVDNSMIRFPKEMQRLADLYQAEEKSSNLSTEYLSEEMKPVNSYNKDHSFTATALAWIFNIAGLILLAF